MPDLREGPLDATIVERLLVPGDTVTVVERRGERDRACRWAHR
ncbi:hypothetical protein ACH4SP_28345 [Streptomyces sp. NPDC021093]